MTDRVQTLEEKVAFLEKAVADLDEVVRELNRALSQTRRDMADLQDHVERHQPGDDSRDQRPPHWGPTW